MRKNLRIWIYSLVVIGAFIVLASSCQKSEDKEDPVVTDIDDNIDIDGNVYTTITIGTQVWMVENLKTTKYRNGDPISNETNNSAWASLKKGAQCDYENNATNAIKYGKIYNWYAVNDSRKIAPTGWHIPSDTEWTTLTNYLAANLGVSSSVVKAIAAKSDWVSSTEVNAVGNDLTKNNSSGFTALPGGIRGLNGPTGIFAWVRTAGFWWSTSKSKYDAMGNAWGIRFNSSMPETGSFFMVDGISVRCIKD